MACSGHKQELFPPHGTGNTAYGNKTVQGNSSASRIVYVSVMAVPKASAADASAAAAAAASTGRAALLAASTAWWKAYWEQSFVTLPVTRAEGFYYTQMYVRRQTHY